MKKLVSFLILVAASGFTQETVNIQVEGESYTIRIPANLRAGFLEVSRLYLEERLARRSLAELLAQAEAGVEAMALANGEVLLRLSEMELAYGEAIKELEEAKGKLEGMRLSFGVPDMFQHSLAVLPRVILRWGVSVPEYGGSLLYHMYFFERVSVVLGAGWPLEFMLGLGWRLP